MMDGSGFGNFWIDGENLILECAPENIAAVKFGCRCAAKKEIKFQQRNNQEHQWRKSERKPAKNC
jgi:hypothetical protein